MPMSKTEFKALYAAKSRELTGREASDEEMEEDYKDYLELIDFEDEDGVPSFEKEGASGMTWYFKPLALT